ncbi:MAG: 2-dehydro-3-deoxygalactonokinase [Rhodobacteraceae bacterium]|nr:2-dehydro-3-deoxygalactonokinase [Paracoccaceae bacterium]
MTQDTWAYVACNAGRVEYSIFDARDTRVAHGAVALSEFGPHEPKDVLTSLDVSFVVLDGAFAGQGVTCPASLAAPIEIGGQFARMTRFTDKSAPDQCFAHAAALGAFVADHAKWDGIVIFAGPVTTWAQVSAGELISFRSSLALKIGYHVMLDRGLDTPDQVGDGFNDAVGSGLSNPETVFSKLSASVGAETHLGHVLGAELAAFRSYWLGQDIVILGEGDAAHWIEAALKSQFAMVRRDPQDYLGRGARAARAHVMGET